MIRVNQCWLRVIGATLLCACEQQKQNDAHKIESKAVVTKLEQWVESDSGLQSGERDLSDLPDAKVLFGRYLVLKEEGYESVFYRPSHGSVWKAVGGLVHLEEESVDPAIDTANIDKQGPAELIIRQEYSSYGSGSGYSWAGVSIYRCEGEKEPREVFFASRYYDERGNGRESYVEQDIKLGYGLIKLGPIKNVNMHCQERGTCEGPIPTMKPGYYQLLGDTVVRLNKRRTL